MEKHFKLRGATSPVLVDVRLARGEVIVEPALAGAVEVELTAHDAASQELADAARVELHDGAAGQQLVVDVPDGRFDFVFNSRGITCRIRCPEGSNLAVQSKSAGVDVRGTIGRVDVRTASGDVKLQDVSGDLTVNGASGAVNARDVAGNANVETASGDVALTSVHGTTTIKTASGAVRLDAADDDVTTNSISGDQKLEAVMKGTVNVNGVSGSVRIGIRRGSRVHLDCQAVSGKTKSELEVSDEPGAGDGPQLEVRARTVSGDITIARAAAPSQSQKKVYA